MRRPTGILTTLVLLLASSCGGEQGPSGAVSPPVRPPDRDTWWTEATTHPAGRERILAPREMRALLRDGERFGFGADAAWWAERRSWVYSRILEMDPDDVEANEAMGRKTLQGIEGFRELWTRMLETRAPCDAITELLDRYDVWVDEGRPIFLTQEEYELTRSRLQEARLHLERLASEPAYAALQVALVRVRSSSLNDYPFVHAAAGPFLLFYSARDLQRIEEEDEEAENRRISARREYYEGRLASWGETCTALLEDIGRLYPELAQRYLQGPQRIHYQWIFGDHGWFREHKDRLHREEPEPTYRCGFFDAATGWAFLHEPAPPQGEREAGGSTPPEDIVRSTIAYLAACQLLRSWARDESDLMMNNLDRSRAYWLQEGWPSFLAARRIDRPQVGRRLVEARRFGWFFPPLTRVLERESRLELSQYREPPPPRETIEEEDRGALSVRREFTDLAWLIVRALNEERHREAFERYLLSQIQGSRHGFAWFEECFGLQGGDALRAFENEVYASIEEN